MTIYDISKEAGVSIATVSRVINGSTKVSEATRAKVLSIIERSGYSPNVFARGLGLNTMHTVGILCADCSDPYLAEAVYYLERELSANDYDMILYCTGYQLAHKQKCLELLLSKHVDAIIFVGSNYVEPDDKNNAYIKQAAQKVPVMLLNGIIDAPNIYCTLCDDRSAICEVTSLMLNAGLRDILFFYNSTSFSGRNKLAGFRDAFDIAGLPLRDEQFCFFDSRDCVVSEMADRLCSVYDSGMHFSALVAADDRLAVGAIKYAQRRGISVPDELTVTGFNNQSIATYCTPELTSVDNKLRPICTSCVTSLMGILDGNEVPKKIYFSYELVRRESSLF